MKRSKRIRLAGLVLAGTAALIAGSAAAAPAHGTATVTIRHQVRGCHTWSYNGGSYKATIALQIARGTTLTVVNRDVMPHKLHQTSGRALKLTTPAMNRMAAKAQVRFVKAGLYRFTTKAGEDYGWASKMETVGEDNVLRLTVRVR
ncbi:MAG TPA: hypothetical protein VF877_05985 [Gaiellaceae bacterium]